MQSTTIEVITDLIINNGQKLTFPNFKTHSGVLLRIIQPVKTIFW